MIEEVLNTYGSLHHKMFDVSDQGWAINFARGPIWEGRVDGGPYLLVDVEACPGL